MFILWIYKGVAVIDFGPDFRAFQRDDEFRFFGGRLKILHGLAAFGEVA